MSSSTVLWPALCIAFAFANVAEGEAKCPYNPSADINKALHLVSTNTKQSLAERAANRALRYEFRIDSDLRHLQPFVFDCEDLPDSFEGRRRVYLKWYGNYYKNMFGSEGSHRHNLARKAESGDKKALSELVALTINDDAVQKHLSDYVIFYIADTMLSMRMKKGNFFTRRFNQHFAKYIPAVRENLHMIDLGTVLVPGFSAAKNRLFISDIVGQAADEAKESFFEPPEVHL